MLQIMIQNGNAITVITNGENVKTSEYNRENFLLDICHTTWVCKSPDHFWIDNFVLFA